MQVYRGLTKDYMHVSLHNNLLVKERAVESKGFILSPFSTDVDSIQLVLGVGWGGGGGGGQETSL